MTQPTKQTQSRKQRKQFKQIMKIEKLREKLVMLRTEVHHDIEWEYQFMMRKKDEREIEIQRKWTDTAKVASGANEDHNGCCIYCGWRCEFQESHIESSQWAGC